MKKTKIEVTTYAFDSGEEIDIKKGTSVSLYEMDAAKKEKSYRYVCLQQARRVWNYEGASAEQLLIWLKDRHTWHNFLPKFEIDNAVLVKVMDGKEKDVIVWMDKLNLC